MLFLLIIAGSCIVLRAHTLPISYLTIVPDTDYIHLELVLNPFELSFFSELDHNGNRRLEAAELSAHEAAVVQRLTGALELQLAARTLPAVAAGVTVDLESHHISLRAHYKGDATAGPVSIRSRLIEITSGSHLTQVVYAHAGGRLAAQLDTHSRLATFGAAPLPKPVTAAAPRINSVAAWIILVMLGIPVTLLAVAAAWLIGRSIRHSHQSVAHQHP